MILLDTDVISAFMGHAPDDAVVDWLNGQTEGSIWTTAITVFEIESRLQRLARGNRRNRLVRAFRSLLSDDLEERILPFDALAAIDAGVLSDALEAQGRTLEIRDVQIASIARVRNAPVATRNAKHFEGVCEVINPWDAA